MELAGLFFSSFSDRPFGRDGESTRQARSDNNLIELHRLAFLESAKRAGIRDDAYYALESASVEMIRLHLEQSQRDDGLPYCCHPLDVAKACIESFGITDKDTVIAALFHDSLEDQVDKILEGITCGVVSEEERFDLARKLLKEKWGAKVSNLVTLLTNPNFTAAAEHLQTNGDLREIQEIKHELYYNHVMSLLDYPEAFAIKMADYHSNALSVFFLQDSPQKQKLISKYTPVISSLLQMLERGDFKDSPYIEHIVRVMEPEFERFLEDLEV